MLEEFKYNETPKSVGNKECITNRRVPAVLCQYLTHQARAGSPDPSAAHRTPPGSPAPSADQASGTHHPDDPPRLTNVLRAVPFERVV